MIGRKRWACDMRVMLVPDISNNEETDNLDCDGLDCDGNRSWACLVHPCVAGVDPFAAVPILRTSLHVSVTDV